MASTRLSWDYSHEEFWIGVIHFFNNHPRLDGEDIRSIVDYLHDQKFAWREVVIGDGVKVENNPPPQPGLSIKGRTVTSLKRQVAEWREQRKASEALQPVLFQWPHSTIDGYSAIDDEGKTWTISEILDSNALADEGKAMRHCAADYLKPCLRRSTTLWSMRAVGPHSSRRVLTIEVNPETLTVEQAKAKCNNAPSDTAPAPSGVGPAPG